MSLRSSYAQEKLWRPKATLIGWYHTTQGNCRGNLQWLRENTLRISNTGLNFPYCSFRNNPFEGLANLLGVTTEQYTAGQMTYDLRRLCLKGLMFRPPRSNRYFVTPYGWKVARLFSRLDARVFRPAMAMFTATEAVLPFPLRQALDRVDTQLDHLIYEAFPLPKAG